MREGPHALGVDRGVRRDCRPRGVLALGRSEVALHGAEMTNAEQGHSESRRGGCVGTSRCWRLDRHDRGSLWCLDLDDSRDSHRTWVFSRYGTAGASADTDAGLRLVPPDVHDETATSRAVLRSLVLLESADGGALELSGAARTLASHLETDVLGCRPNQRRDRRRASDVSQGRARRDAPLVDRTSEDGTAIAGALLRGGLFLTNLSDSASRQRVMVRQTVSPALDRF
jgi:hypothetical protein